MSQVDYDILVQHFLDILDGSNALDCGLSCKNISDAFMKAHFLFAAEIADEDCEEEEDCKEEFREARTRCRSFRQNELNEPLKQQ